MKRDLKGRWIKGGHRHKTGKMVTCSDCGKEMYRKPCSFTKSGKYKCGECYDKED